MFGTVFAWFFVLASYRLGSTSVYCFSTFSHASCVSLFAGKAHSAGANWQDNWQFPPDSMLLKHLPLPETWMYQHCFSQRPTPRPWVLMLTVNCDSQAFPGWSTLITGASAEPLLVQSTLEASCLPGYSPVVSPSDALLVHGDQTTFMEF